MMTKIGCMSNAILRRLPESDFLMLAPRMSLVDLKLGQVILHVRSKIGTVFFPLDCVISMVCSMRSGQEAEVVGVSNEGAVGIVKSIGQDVSQHVAKVAVRGYAASLPTDAVVEQALREVAFQSLALQYMNARMELSHLNTACARFHSVKEQLAKWLLLSMDRHNSGEMKLTHDTLSHALGGRRESLTAAACEFKRLGLVDYSRGCFSVLDSKGLESQACECCGMSKAFLFELHHANGWIGHTLLGSEKNNLVI